MTSRICQRIACSQRFSEYCKSAWKTTLIVPISYDGCAESLTVFMERSGGCGVLLDCKLEILIQSTEPMLFPGKLSLHGFWLANSETMEGCAVCKSLPWWKGFTTSFLLSKLSCRFDMLCWQSVYDTLCIWSLMFELGSGSLRGSFGNKHRSSYWGRFWILDDPRAIAWHLGDRNSLRSSSCNRGEVETFLYAFVCGANSFFTFVFPLKSTRKQSLTSKTIAWYHVPNVGPLWKK